MRKCSLIKLNIIIAALALLVLLTSCAVVEPGLSFGDDKNGTISIELENGDVFSGELIDGIPNRSGEYISISGWSYDGEYKNGYRNGEGVLTFSDGSRYEGQLKVKWKELL